MGWIIIYGLFAVIITAHMTDTTLRVLMPSLDDPYVVAIIVGIAMAAWGVVLLAVLVFIRDELRKLMH